MENKFLKGLFIILGALCATAGVGVGTWFILDTDLETSTRAAGIAAGLALLLVGFLLARKGAGTIRNALAWLFVLVF